MHPLPDPATNRKSDAASQSLAKGAYRKMLAEISVDEQSRERLLSFIGGDDAAHDASSPCAKDAEKPLSRPPGEAPGSAVGMRAVDMVRFLQG